MFTHWDRTTFDADGLQGERLGLTTPRGRFTVVVWPGRATRVFHPGGHTLDYTGRDSRGQAVRYVEEEALGDRNA